MRNPPKMKLKLKNASKNIEFVTLKYINKTYLKMLKTKLNEFSTNVTPNWAIYDLTAFKISKGNPITSVGSTHDHTVAKKIFSKLFWTRLQPSKSFYKLTKKGTRTEGTWTLGFFKQIFKNLENWKKIPQRGVLIDFNFLEAWTSREN